MKIETGKFYRTKGGRKVGPMEAYKTIGGYSWRGEIYHEDGSRRTGWWARDDGGFSPRDTHGLDIVALWSDEPASPVRTVTTTRKIIEPGTYGRLYIDRQRVDGKTALIFVDRMPDGYALLTPAELRAAASIFTQIADALDEQP